MWIHLCRQYIGDKTLSVQLNRKPLKIAVSAPIFDIMRHVAYLHGVYQLQLRMSWGCAPFPPWLINRGETRDGDVSLFTGSRKTRPKSSSTRGYHWIAAERLEYRARYFDTRTCYRRVSSTALFSNNSFANKTKKSFYIFTRLDKP